MKARDNSCTSCGAELDGATAPSDPEARPQAGDVTVCAYCGQIMAFADDLSLRNLTDAEMVEMAGNKEILAIQRARAAILPPSRRMKDNGGR